MSSRFPDSGLRHRFFDLGQVLLRGRQELEAKGWGRMRPRSHGPRTEQNWSPARSPSRQVPTYYTEPVEGIDRPDARYIEHCIIREISSLPHPPPILRDFVTKKKNILFIDIEQLLLLNNVKVESFV